MSENEPSLEVTAGPGSGPADGASTSADSARPSAPYRDGAAPPTDAPEAPPTRRAALRRPRNLLLLGLALLAVVLVATLGPMSWALWSEKGGRIGTPQRVAGLVLDDSKGAHDTVDYMRTAIETGVTLDDTVGAVYADDAGEARSVLFVGGTGTIVEPASALDKAFGLITDDAGGVDAIRDVPAGPLGGVMKCGTTKTDGKPMAVCGWADHGSVGIAMFPNRPTEQSAELLRTMRTAMQHRG